MKATTIKVEGDLLEELERRKPPTQSLSAFVKSVLRRDLLRRRLADAAHRYAEFVAENREEKSSLEKWEAADLVAKPSTRRRR
jgi:Arc/MetJ family transcription regulator